MKKISLFNFRQFLVIENIFVIIFLLSGLLLSIIIPPNQAPDETAHFARVYGFVHGSFGPVVEMPEKVYNLMQLYWEDKQNGSFLDFNSYLKRFSENMDQKKMIQSEITTTYSPILYIPQIIGLAFGLSIGLNFYGYYFSGRIFSLLFYCFIGYIVLKKTPAPKMSMFVLLTMPMSIYLAASYSGDAVQNILSFAYIFLIVNYVRSNQQLKKSDWAVFIITSIFLALTKPISLILIFLSLMIPVSRFKDIYRKLLFTATQFIFGFIFLAGWEKFIFRSQFVSKPSNDVIPPLQLANILINPITYINVLLTTLNHNISDYIYGFIGKIGWVDIPFPEFVNFLFFIILILAIIYDANEGLVLTKVQKLVIFLVFSLYSLALFTTMYLVWSDVGADVVSGIQGRYFIPTFPLLIIFIISLKPASMKLPFEKVFLYWAIVILTSLFLFFSIQIIYLRYFTQCGNYYYSINNDCAEKYGNMDETPKATVGIIDKTFSQNFDAKCNNLNGISILFIPAKGINDGNYEINLIESKSSRVVYHGQFMAKTLDKNKWLTTHFSPQESSINKQYTLEISPSTNPIDLITLGSSNPGVFGYDLSGVESPSNLDFYYECPSGFLSSFRRILH